jgi:hypothetical protein
MGQHPYLYLRYPGFLSKALTLSYDDGVVADLRLMEILNANGIKCTFNLNSGLFGLGTRLPEDKIIGHYVASAHEIAVHGYKHLALSALQAPALIAEILEDRKNLEALTGAPVTGMAYAYGDFDDRVVSLLADCGITYSRTVTSTHAFSLPTKPLLWDPTCHHNDPRLMELAKRFAEEKTYRDEPALFYLWGHSYEFDEKHDNNWELIEKFLELMGGHDDIWYATNIEIYDYIDAYKRLQFSAKGDTVYNPSAIRIWFSINHEVVSVGAGETLKLF